MDFGLDSDGDLNLKGGMTIVTDADELVQRLTIGLTINLNEFFSHTNYGLPWISPYNTTDNDIVYFLGDQDVTISYIAETIKDYILTIPQIVSVTYEYSFDPITRKLTYKPYPVAVGGETLVFPPYVLDI